MHYLMMRPGPATQFVAHFINNIALYNALNDSTIFKRKYHKVVWVSTIGITHSSPSLDYHLKTHLLET